MRAALIELEFGEAIFQNVECVAVCSDPRFSMSLLDLRPSRAPVIICVHLQSYVMMPEAVVVPFVDLVEWSLLIKEIACSVSFAGGVAVKLLRGLLTHYGRSDEALGHTEFLQALLLVRTRCWGRPRCLRLPSPGSHLIYILSKLA